MECPATAALRLDAKLATQLATQAREGPVRGLQPDIQLRPTRSGHGRKKRHPGHGMGSHPAQVRREHEGVGYQGRPSVHRQAAKGAKFRDGGHGRFPSGRGLRCRVTLWRGSTPAAWTSKSLHGVATQFLQFTFLGLFSSDSLWAFSPWHAAVVGSAEKGLAYYWYSSTTCSWQELRPPLVHSSKSSLMLFTHSFMLFGVDMTGTEYSVELVVDRSATAKLLLRHKQRPKSQIFGLSPASTDKRSHQRMTESTGCVTFLALPHIPNFGFAMTTAWRLTAAAANRPAAGI